MKSSDMRNKDNKQGNLQQRRQQPRKDNRSKRVNFDNTRQSKFEKNTDEVRGKFGKDCNDVQWYAASPELLKAACSYNTFTSSGLPVGWKNMAAVPGIMAVHWNPWVNGGDRSAVQQAANSVYSFLVHANSRNYNYDPADLMLMIVAGASLFSQLSHAIRAYGVMQRFNQVDYYTPEALVTAMGFNYTDLRANLSQMWFDINEMINRSRQIWIPDSMPILMRWFWLNAHIYRDAESAKSQYYLFVPKSYFIYQEKTETTGGSLEVVNWPVSANYTWAQFKTLINQMFDALLNAQDRGMIFGDILNAYGKEHIFAISPIASDYMVEPVYNKEVLWQIENSTCLRATPAKVIQDGNGNLYETMTPVPISTWNATKVASRVGLTKAILNFHQVEAPTPEQVMIATRLITLGALISQVNAAEGSNPATYAISPATCGSEFVYGYTMYQYTWNNGTRSLIGTDYEQFVSSTDATALPMVMEWMAFDWAPWFYVIDSSDIQTPSSTSQLYDDYSALPYRAAGDYDYYMTIDTSVLSKMHTAAIYSEFGVPVQM